LTEDEKAEGSDLNYLMLHFSYTFTERLVTTTHHCLPLSYHTVFTAEKLNW